MIAPRLITADDQPRGAPLQKPIPSSQQLLAVIGMGTWRTFNVGSDPQFHWRLLAELNVTGDYIRAKLHLTGLFIAENWPVPVTKTGINS